jgi:arsenate reductase
MPVPRLDAAGPPATVLPRRAVAELVGTALLAVAAVGSGIAAARLSPTDAGVQLLLNAAATGAALVALVTALRPISGAHLNPAVTVAHRAAGVLSNREATGYLAAQLLGAAGGTVLANAMFALPVVAWSDTGRSAGGLWLGEGVATFGLVLIVFSAGRAARTPGVAAAVGAYIAGAVLFTSSNAFANPALTVARTLTDTVVGIRPSSVPGFLAAQAVGTTLALGVLAVVRPAEEQPTPAPRPPVETSTS